MMQEKLQVDSAAVTDKGLSEKRPQNEDSYLELRESGLFAVADGVGGAQAGDVASQMAMEILGEAFINLQEDGDVEERMRAAINQANGAIFQMSNELAQLSTMATTIVALHINGNIATIGHVGDSRLYRLDESGTLFRETQDHSVVEEEVRAGRMTPEQALNHPSRNVISRALGAEQTVEIDMKTIMFEPNTKFLICSDGITRHVSDEELNSILRQESDNFTICQTLKDICYERGAEDNLTAVVVSVGEASEAAFSAASNANRDFEEETVASARPPLVNSSVLGQASGGDHLPDEQNVSPSDVSRNENKENEFDDEISIPTISESNGNTISISTRSEEEAEKAETVSEKSRSGILGFIISGIVWLLIGAAVGVLGFYFYQNSSLSVENSTGNSKSAGQIEAFEQERRLVDNNPGLYISTRVNPETPIDHYFLGRANYLNGNFATAKMHFGEARAGINEVEEANRKVVENDISIMLENIETKTSSGETNTNTGVENNQGAETNTLENTNSGAAGGEQLEVPPANNN